MSYKTDYNKKNYARFLVDLPIKEKQELDNLLKERNLTKAEFLRKAINNLKGEKYEKYK